MISVLKNPEGLVFAYMEWSVVDETGARNNKGHYLHVHQLWIHPDSRKQDAIRALISECDGHEKMKDVVGVYWKNLRRGKRPTPLFPRERLAKMARKGIV